MPGEPMSVFGSLMFVCVRDDYSKERGIVIDGLILALFGALSSALTAYLLSAAHIFV